METLHFKIMKKILIIIAAFFIVENSYAQVWQKVGANLTIIDGDTLPINNAFSKYTGAFLKDIRGRVGVSTNAHDSVLVYDDFTRSIKKKLIAGGGGGGTTYTFSPPLINTGGLVSAADATATTSGIVNATTQTFGGNKIFTGLIQQSTNAPIGTPSISAIGNKDAFEWGASSSNDFHSSIGFETSSGRPYIAFNAVAGTNTNTYKTSGKKGTILQSDNNGGFLVGNTPLVNADNQSLNYIFIVKPDGSIVLGSTSSNSKFQSNALTYENTIPSGISGGSVTFAAPSGAYGLTSSVSNNGDYLEQVQRLDGGGALYNRILQPNGGNLGIGTASPNSTLSTNGSIATTLISKNANYTATATDNTINVTTVGVTITLPTAIGIQGREYTIINSTSGNITITTTASQTIGNFVTTTSFTLATDKALKVQSDNTNYKIKGQF